MDKHLGLLDRLSDVSGRRVLVGVSGGKDSITVLDLLSQRGFTIFAYALYSCPDIGFWERQIDALERRYAISIPRFPHPDLCAYIQAGHYRQALPGFPTLKHSELLDTMRSHHGDLSLWVANGEKMSDALQRRGMISKVGGLDEKRRVAYPLAHWNDREVFAYLKHRRVPLPPDYSSGLGGSWGGRLTPEWLAWIHQTYPADFRQLERFYPHIRAALLKPSRMKAHRT